MPRIGSLAALLWVASAVGAILPAQGAEVALADRAPRFLMASPSGGAPLVVDTRSVPALWRRISVDLNDVTLEQALNTVSREAGLKLMYSKAVVPLDNRVHLQASNITVAGALIELLLDAGVDVLLARDGQLVLVKSVQGGTVAGRVTDAKTGKAVPNVSVYLEGTRWRTTTGENGVYRLVEVTAGTYTLTASRIGYARQSQSVRVASGQEVTADVALQGAASELEQVVVTGTVTETRERELPSPISVITADQIQQKNIQRVDELFRGDIPGALAWDQGSYNYYSTINIRGASSLGQPGYVKTYIDGVEVVVPSFIATIDPNSIDHVEVIRGPQASTVYGSEALNGVMQIFTKRATLDQPLRADLKVSAGPIQTKWVDQWAAARQDYAGSVSGGTPDYSFTLGGTHLNTGEWLTHYSNTANSIYGSVGGIKGRLTLNLSARYYNLGQELAINPVAAPYVGKGFRGDEDQTVQAGTYAVALQFAATPRWHHRLTLGYDRMMQDQSRDAKHEDPGDTLAFVYHAENSKASVTYNTTLDLPLSRAVASTLTLGADHFGWRVNYVSLGAQQTTGSFSGVAFYYAGRIVSGNSGYFAQWQLGLKDAFFLTAGLRAEANDNFGPDYGLAWAPRIGAAYNIDVGAVTVKTRLSYGKAIRPPYPGSSGGTSTPYQVQLANPNLGPELQRGVDGGVELYFGDRASMEVTYYHQRAVDLIDYVLIQPATSSTPQVNQYQNIGQVLNRGWEFQGRLALSGTLAASATMSVTRSTVEQLSPTYTGELRPGDKILGLPELSGGATLTYALPHGSVSVGATAAGSWTEHDWVALFGVFLGGQPYRGSFRDYWITYPGFVKLNLGVSQDLTPRLTGFIDVKNVANRYVYEQSNIYVTSGRTTMVGLRARLY